MVQLRQTEGLFLRQHEKPAEAEEQKRQEAEMLIEKDSRGQETG